MITILIFAICIIVSMCISCAITCAYFKRAMDELHAENAALASDLRGQKAARKEQTRKYDDLYDQFFRLTQYNSEMAKEVQSYKNTYKEAADEVYSLYLQGKSRQELCQLYPRVAYSTICGWIIKKRKEALDQVDPANTTQGKLI